MKYEIRFKKDRERGGEISVNFVSKGEASTFARAFELNFFTKAHLHVKGKTRVKGSFFLPLEYLTNSKDRLKFVESVSRCTPLCLPMNYYAISL